MTVEKPSTTVESKTVRFSALLLAWLLAAMFFVWTQAYFEPLHVGPDQNGYLVGGKQFSRTLLPRQRPTQIGKPTEPDLHAHVASMWVAGANDKNAFDPKYPMGLPLIYALTILLTGGTTAAFYVSPIAMALTLPGVFVLVRRFAGSYAGLLAVLAFGTSPLIGGLVNNPNSHATNVFCATWGMAAVLHWWDNGGKRWAVAGGLLVGYAATVRYTEGMLVFPLIWTALERVIGWRAIARAAVATTPAEATLPIVVSSEQGMKYQAVAPEDDTPRPFGRLMTRCVEPLLLLSAWAVPVICLVAYNLFFLGTLTGYDATNESTGFGWTYFFDNWETLTRNLSSIGLFMLLPLGVIGLIRMAWLDTRHALFLLLWTVPCLTLYSFYYWGPDGISYMRFMTSTLPPLLAAAFWLMQPRRSVDAAESSAVVRRPRRIVWTAARLALVVLAGVTAGAIVYYTVRLDHETVAGHEKWTLASVTDYLNRPPTTYQRTGGAIAFYGGIVAAVAIAAAVAATSRRSAGAMAIGLVTLLSVTEAADESRLWQETYAYDTRIWQAVARGVREQVPDGAVLICPQETILNCLQFVTEDRLYTGLSFDHSWIMGRPRAASDDPVLIDPVRGQQLFDALSHFTQPQLNDQARAAVKAALDAHRRVFVVEAAAPDAIRQANQKKQEGPVPEFVRRFINRPKDTSLVGRRIGWWTVPMVVKDEWKNIPRGPKPGHPGFRVTCYQTWEITNG